MRFRAAADGRQSTEIAVSANTTGALARILADTIDTGRSAAGTVPVAVAFGPALGVRTSDVTGRALADGPVITRHFAVSTFAALIAGTDALVSGAVLLGTTLGVVFAFMATAR